MRTSDLTEALLLGLASFSLWKFIIADRITRWVRYRWINFLIRHNNWLAYHLQYLAGCVLCFPLWSSGILYFLLHPHLPVGTAGWAHTVVIVFGARVTAYLIARQFGEAGARDLPPAAKDPNTGIDIWPPQKEKIVNAGQRLPIVEDR